MSIEGTDAEPNGDLRPVYDRPAIRLASQHASRRQTENKAQASPRRFPVDRSGIRYVARTLDVFVGVIVVFVSSLSLNVDLLEQSLSFSLPFVLAPLAAFFGMRISGAYWFSYDEHATTHMVRTVWGAGAGLLLVIGLSYLLGLNADSHLLIHVTGIALLALTAMHAHYIAFVKALTRAGRLSDNVIIVGATQAASHLVQKNEERRELNILGVFDDRLDRAPDNIHGIPVVGTVDELMEWDKLPTVDRIIVTVTSTAQARVRHLVDRLRGLPQEVILVLDLDGFAPEHTSVASIIDAPAAYVSGAPRDARRATVKRLTDLVAGSMMLMLFAPVMAVIALLIKLDSPGPVFFRQKRHGFNNQTIRVWKFRTMNPDKVAEEGMIRQTVAGDERVTRIGAFLRRTSLDELPQLFNILKGEMSLVGPRPHAVGMTTEEVEVHTIVGEYAHRHRMKPGLTGWAQINGSRGPVHTADLVKERVRLDMEYVEKASFWFDLYIIFMTAPCLLGDSKAMR